MAEAFLYAALRLRRALIPLLVAGHHQTGAIAVRGNFRLEPGRVLQGTPREHSGGHSGGFCRIPVVLIGFVGYFFFS
jgi:hypothetical protein